MDKKQKVDQHGVITTRLPQLPDPPEDLSKPWNLQLWLRWLLVAFFLVLFGLWFLGQKFSIQFFDLGGSCIASWGIFLFLGLFLINWSGKRGFREHYSPRSNPALWRSIKSFRKKKPRESYFSLFPQYLIEDQAYYLVWYVPGSGSTLVRELAQGSEPLLFNKAGEIIEDEGIFAKVLLMWSYGLNFSPGTLRNKLTEDRKQLKTMLEEHFNQLPRLLDQNAAIFIDLGLKTELQLVKDGLPSKGAYFLHSIDILNKKIAWAEAHGWDSVACLQFCDLSAYHMANIKVIQARNQLVENYQLEKRELAAKELANQVRAHSANWTNQNQLMKSLEVFSTTLPVGEIHIQESADGQWLPPKQMLQAFRSRIKYAQSVMAQ